MSAAIQSPWLVVTYSQKEIYVSLTVPMGEGRRKTFTARVPIPVVLAELRRRGVVIKPQIGGFFGKIWKGIKKVGKKLGVNKVINLAAKALPVAAKFLPPPLNLAPAGAAMAIRTAKGLAGAAGLRKKGKKKKAARVVRRLARQNKKARKVLGSARAKAARKSGQRLYKIMVSPA